MKKQLCGILMLGFSLALFSGCSNDSPSPVTAPSISQTPKFITLPKRLNNSLKKQVSVTQFIYAAQGGTLRLVDTYRAAPDSHIVTIDLALEFRPGDLPYDASLTVTIDDELFLANVDMTFGPHGIVFNRPAKLTVTATGLNLVGVTTNMKLYYDNNSVWTLMQGSNAIYSAGSLDAQGRLPHFSRYAFGRIDE